MDALLKGFTGIRPLRRAARATKETYDAELYCTFEYGGQEVPCKASVRRHSGTLPDSKHIEIGRVQGLPAGVKYDHDEFAAWARKYYSEQILKRGD